MTVSTPTSSDKNIVDKTRRVSASARLVKDLRQRVGTEMAAPQPHEAELVRTFAETQRNAFFAMPVLIAIVAVIASRYIGVMPALYWFALAALSSGLLAIIAGRFSEELANAHGETARFLPIGLMRSYRLAQLLAALSWAVFAVYDCATCGPEDSYDVVRFTVILVLQAISTMMSYGMGASVLMISGPPTAALAVSFGLDFSTGQTMMALIVLGSQIFFYAVAIYVKRSFVTILAHKAENEQLVAELEVAKSISEEARRRAEAANLAKSRFLATMSHELRTPLNAILGFSEVMQAEVLGPVGNRLYMDYINDIHSSGQHLLNVINEILDLSRIEAGRHELREEAVKLAHVVEEARNMVKIKAGAKSISIHCQYQDGLPMIWADERAVRQITLNLLSNALKFTPLGGAITIKVGWTKAGGQYLAVKDNGPGIPEEEIPVVLSSFGQGSIAIKSAEQGTGLGLPIVQALMHMHDGKFELKSKLREGVEAIATFPRSRVLEVLGSVPGANNAAERPRSLLGLKRAG